MTRGYERIIESVVPKDPSIRVFFYTLEGLSFSGHLVQVTTPLLKFMAEFVHNKVWPSAAGFSERWSIEIKICLDDESE